MSGLIAFSESARKTDTLVHKPDHDALLAMGLLGEVGGVLAEFKKKTREGPAYPLYQSRLEEELGDALWYFVRLASIRTPELLQTLPLDTPRVDAATRGGLSLVLELGAAVGRVLEAVQRAQTLPLTLALTDTWMHLRAVAASAGIELAMVVQRNRDKTQSRWPSERMAHALFDEGYLPEERLPRMLTVEFLARGSRDKPQILLRYNGINIGDRITDNIGDPDGYRFHDIFHFAYAVYLGWSPVMRALLRCKRKSDPSTDENQDGARAVILEEAVSAIVFSHAKQVGFFENLQQVDYALLKSIQEFIRGYEVEKVPVWQWEEAILEGFRAFRQLKSQNGGRVTLHLDARELIVERLR